MNSTRRIYHSDVCAICYEPYEKTQPNDCLLLKCGHIFHESCVTVWIDQQSNCPLCKRKAFIPILLKDIVKETVQQGIEGAKKSGKYISVTAALITTVAIFFGTLDYLFPGRWPTSEEEIDTYINEHGVIFDFRKPDGFIKLGLTTLAITGIGSAFYIIKSLKQRRNQPVEAAERMNYIPPDET